MYLRLFSFCYLVIFNQAVKELVQDIQWLKKRKVQLFINTCMPAKSPVQLYRVKIINY